MPKLPARAMPLARTEIASAVESFGGLLLIAVMTGVVFARFSRPSPRVMFSRVALITMQEGKRVLMVRLANERATAIVAQDKASITRADGVGPKLAARILTELKDKAVALAPVAVVADTADGTTADAVSALVNLGYARGDAYGAVAEAARRLGRSARLDALIKAGLRELGR